MITLIQGDCFEQMPKLETQSVDMVITSPPYNRKRNDKYNNHTDIKRDYVAFLEKSINECLRVCKGNVFFNLQKNTYNKQDVHKIMGMFSEKIIEVLIWKKSNPMPNPHLINAYEYILVLSENNKSLKANKTYTLDTVLDPFMGVGTTGAVCKNRKRNFIGIELDKTYFEICEAGLT